jgi:hypothetical protein
MQEARQARLAAQAEAADRIKVAAQRVRADAAEAGKKKLPALAEPAPADYESKESAANEPVVPGMQQVTATDTAAGNPADAGGVVGVTYTNIRLHGVDANHQAWVDDGVSINPMIAAQSRASVEDAVWEKVWFGVTPDLSDGSGAGSVAGERVESTPSTRSDSKQASISSNEKRKRSTRSPTSSPSTRNAPRRKVVEFPPLTPLQQAQEAAAKAAADAAAAQARQEALAAEAEHAALVARKEWEELEGGLGQEQGADELDAQASFEQQLGEVVAAVLAQYDQGLVARSLAGEEESSDRVLLEQRVVEAAKQLLEQAQANNEGSEAESLVDAVISVLISPEAMAAGEALAEAGGLAASIAHLTSSEVEPADDGYGQAYFKYQLSSDANSADMQLTQGTASTGVNFWLETPVSTPPNASPRSWTKTLTSLLRGLRIPSRPGSIYSFYSNSRPASILSSRSVQSSRTYSDGSSSIAPPAHQYGRSSSDDSGSIAAASQAHYGRGGSTSSELSYSSFGSASSSSPSSQGTQGAVSRNPVGARIGSWGLDVRPSDSASSSLEEGGNWDAKAGKGTKAALKKAFKGQAQQPATWDGLVKQGAIPEAPEDAELQPAEISLQGTWNEQLLRQQPAGSEGSFQELEAAQEASAADARDEPSSGWFFRSLKKRTRRTKPQQQSGRASLSTAASGSFKAASTKQPRLKPRGVWGRIKRFFKISKENKSPRSIRNIRDSRGSRSAESSLSVTLYDSPVFDHEDHGPLGNDGGTVRPGISMATAAGWTVWYGGMLDSTAGGSSMSGTDRSDPGEGALQASASVGTGISTSQLGQLQKLTAPAPTDLPLEVASRSSDWSTSSVTEPVLDPEVELAATAAASAVYADIDMPLDEVMKLITGVTLRDAKALAPKGWPQQQLRQQQQLRAGASGAEQQITVEDADVAEIQQDEGEALEGAAGDQEQQENVDMSLGAEIADDMVDLTFEGVGADGEETQQQEQDEAVFEQPDTEVQQVVNDGDDQWSEWSDGQESEEGEMLEGGDEGETWEVDQRDEDAMVASGDFTEESLMVHQDYVQGGEDAVMPEDEGDEGVQLGSDFAAEAAEVQDSDGETAQEQHVVADEVVEQKLFQEELQRTSDSLVVYAGVVQEDADQDAEVEIGEEGGTQEDQKGSVDGNTTEVDDIFGEVDQGIAVEGEEEMAQEHLGDEVDAANEGGAAEESSDEAVWVTEELVEVQYSQDDQGLQYQQQSDEHEVLQEGSAFPGDEAAEVPGAMQSFQQVPLLSEGEPQGSDPDEGSFIPLAELSESVEDILERVLLGDIAPTASAEQGPLEEAQPAFGRQKLLTDEHMRRRWASIDSRDASTDSSAAVQEPVVPANAALHSSAATTPLELTMSEQAEVHSAVIQPPMPAAAEGSELYSGADGAGSETLNYSHTELVDMPAQSAESSNSMETASNLPVSPRMIENEGEAAAASSISDGSEASDVTFGLSGRTNGTPSSAVVAAAVAAAVAQLRPPSLTRASSRRSQAVEAVEALQKAGFHFKSRSSSTESSSSKGSRGSISSSISSRASSTSGSATPIRGMKEPGSSGSSTPRLAVNTAHGRPGRISSSSSTPMARPGWVGTGSSSRAKTTTISSRPEWVGTGKTSKGNSRSSSSSSERQELSQLFEKLSGTRGVPADVPQSFPAPTIYVPGDSQRVGFPSTSRARLPPRVPQNGARSSSSVPSRVAPTLHNVVEPQPATATANTDSTTTASSDKPAPAPERVGKGSAERRSSLGGGTVSSTRRGSLGGDTLSSSKRGSIGGGMGSTGRRSSFGGATRRSSLGGGTFKRRSIEEIQAEAAARYEAEAEAARGAREAAAARVKEWEKQRKNAAARGAEAARQRQQQLQTHLQQDARQQQGSIGKPEGRAEIITEAPAYAVNRAAWAAREAELGGVPGVPGVKGSTSSSPSSSRVSSPRSASAATSTATSRSSTPKAGTTLFSRAAKKQQQEQQHMEVLEQQLHDAQHVPQSGEDKPSAAERLLYMLGMTGVVATMYASSLWMMFPNPAQQGAAQPEQGEQVGGEPEQLDGGNDGGRRRGRGAMAQEPGPAGLPGGGLRRSARRAAIAAAGEGKGARSIWPTYVCGQ